jgi:hypothetical protein
MIRANRFPRRRICIKKCIQAQDVSRGGLKVVDLCGDLFHVEQVRLGAQWMFHVERVSSILLEKLL